METALAGRPCRVPVLLDACHAGAVDGGHCKPTDDLMRGPATDVPGRFVLVRCTGRVESRRASRMAADSP
jgi:hypothetical protein